MGAPVLSHSLVPIPAVLYNGCTGKCVRLSRPLVGFWTHFKSLHFHSFHFIPLASRLKWGSVPIDIMMKSALPLCTHTGYRTRLYQFTTNQRSHWQLNSLKNFFLGGAGAPLRRGGLCHGMFGTMVNPAMGTELFNSADDDFFNSVKTNSTPVLQPYLPDQTNIPYRLRTRRHNMTMIKTKPNF